MTLDEMESICNRVVADMLAHPTHPGLGYERQIAKAMLSVLPVVRAAEKHEHVRRECQRTGRGHGALVLASEELEDAIDAHHEEMRKG